MKQSSRFANTLASLLTSAAVLLGVVLMTPDCLLGDVSGLLTTQVIPSSYAGGGFGPEQVAIGDFNGDGNADLALLYPSPDGKANGAVGIIPGNGDGTFQAPVYYPVGVYPQAIVVGDFNNDDHLDLYVADEDGVLYFLQGKGDGSFDQAVMYPPVQPGNLTSLTTADFNGDGRLDIAEGVNAVPAGGFSANWAIFVLLGNGDGTFKSPIQIPSPVSYNSSISEIVTGDLNGDGHPDLVAGSGGGLFTAMGRGDGTFSTPNQVPGTRFITSLSVSVADLNGDHIPDLTMVGVNSSVGGPRNVMTFLGDGHGSFTQAGTFSPGVAGVVASNNALVTGDFNGDGRIDVALCLAANTGAFQVFPGNGDGSFGTPIPIPLGAGVDGWGAAAGDLNHDGKTDIVFIDAVYRAVVPILNTPGSVGAEILPSAHDFGQQTVGTAAASTTITIANPGSSSLMVSGIQLNSADFSQINTCSDPIAPGLNCSIQVQFNPATTGSKTAKLTYSTNDPLLAQGSIVLTGTAIAPVLTSTPDSVNFPPQRVGTASPPQPVQITNSGTGPLSLSVAAAGDFQETNDCPASLAQGASCTTSVTFKPLVAGSETGRLVLTTNTASGQIAVPLAGTGFILGPKLTVSPGTLDFGAQYVGTSSPPGVVTLQNSGDAPIAIHSVSASGAFVPLSTCGNALQAASSCVIGVFFDPGQTGTQMGTLTIFDDLPTSPAIVALSGKGTKITVAPHAGGATASTIAAGQTATFQLDVSPVDGFTGTVQLGCTGLPSGTTCSLSSNQVHLDGGSPSTVTVSVTAPAASAGAVPLEKFPPWGSGARIAAGLLLLLLAPLMVLFLKLRRRTLAFALVLAAAAFMIACGGSSPVAPPANPATGKTYVFFLTAQPANGVTIDTPLTMTVQ